MVMTGILPEATAHGSLLLKEKITARDSSGKKET